MSDDEIIYRQANYTDKEGILELFKSAFKESEVNQKEISAWEWQFVKNPDGSPFIGIAESNQKIVGHYAIIPLNYSTETGAKITVGLVVDVMVHPNYQRKGIFVNLSKFSLNEASKILNLEFCIGYPFTATTYSSVIPGHKKVGWELKNKLDFFVFPLDFSNLLGYFNSISVIIGSISSSSIFHLAIFSSFFPLQSS